MWQGSYELTLNQWGVGHGGFHSQSLFFRRHLRAPRRPLGAGSMLRLIYDCGSGRGVTPKPALADAVARMLRDIPEGSTIDLLVISHFDRDHVNGLDHLAAELKKRHIGVSRVWAPVLSKLEALYAMTSSDDAGGASGTYDSLLLDPTGRLTELFAGAEVSMIRADGEPIPLPPTSRDPADAEEDIDGDEVLLEPAPTGRGLVARRGGAAKREVLWEIQPYVIPSVLEGAANVKAAVRRVTGKGVADCTIDELVALAGDAMLRKDFHDAVLAHHRGLSRTTRRSSARTGSNLSSLCVYSGPASPYEWCHFRNGWLPLAVTPTAIPIAPAWLGTGDAGLLRPQDVDGLRVALTTHRLDRVGITSAPHHGSRLDSSAQFWDSLPNVRRVTIQAHNAHGGTGNAHPHSHVLSELSGRNLEVHICTDQNDFCWRDRRIR